MDLNNSNSWRAVKVNDVVLLSDQQALQDSSKAGLGLKPLQYTVAEITTIQELDDLGTWIFYRLKPAQVQQELMLVCKIVDSEMDLRLYYQTEFAPGSRSGIIQRGDLFIFQPPQNPDNFQVSQLKYTMDLTHDKDRWVLKDFGEMHGEVSFQPPKTGLSEVMATIAEYTLIEGDTLDTEVLFLELGKGAEGFIKMFAGCDVNLSEIDVFPV